MLSYICDIYNTFWQLTDSCINVFIRCICTPGGYNCLIAFQIMSLTVIIIIIIMIIVVSLFIMYLFSWLVSTVLAVKCCSQLWHILNHFSKTIKYNSWSREVALIWQIKTKTAVLWLTGEFLFLIDSSLHFLLATSDNVAMFSLWQHRSDVHRTNTIHNHREIQFYTTRVCYQDSKLNTCKLLA